MIKGENGISESEVLVIGSRFSLLFPYFVLIGKENDQGRCSTTGTRESRLILKEIAEFNQYFRPGQGPSNKSKIYTDLTVSNGHKERNPVRMIVRVHSLNDSDRSSWDEMLRMLIQVLVTPYDANDAQ